MAARRLVVVMLVLLVVSTLAAAFLPSPHGTRTTTSARPATKAPRATSGPPRPSGLLLVSRMRISNLPLKTVRIERGDELRLQVDAPFGDDVEIPALGLDSPVTPFAPATFDILAAQIGTFPVRAVQSGMLAGRLLVAEPGARRCGVSRPEAPRGRGSLPSCGHRGRRSSPGHGRSARRP